MGILDLGILDLGILEFLRPKKLNKVKNENPKNLSKKRF